MTRAQFLNDLYHYLRPLGQEQAEQHLTYYAEMLADRMEEGMTEDEAVAGMEDVETIARRILEEEGLPFSSAGAPPEYPDASKLEGGGGTRGYQAPRRTWQRAAQAALWTIAAIAVLAVVGRGVMRQLKTSSVMEAAPEPEVSCDYGSTDTPAMEEAAPFVWEEAEIGVFDESVLDGIYNFDYVGDMGTVPVEIQRIDIEWAAGEVAVQGWDGDSIQFQEASDSQLNDRTRMFWQADGDTLTVRYREGLGLGGVLGEKFLLMLVPDGMLADLEIQTASADIQLGGLELGTLTAAAASGDITPAGCYAQTAELSATSGNLEFYGFYAEKLTLSTTSGTISGDFAGRDMEAGSASGDMDLTLCADAERVQVFSVSGDVHLYADTAVTTVFELGTVSGDISLSLLADQGFTLDYTTVSGDFLSSSYALSREGGKYVYNGGGCEIEAETVSGDFEIY